MRGEEPTPEIPACLMHPSLLANERFEFGPTGDFDGGVYGLCNLCIKSLKVSSEYQSEIDLEIEKRLRNLHNEEKGVTNGH